MTGKPVRGTGPTLADKETCEQNLKYHVYLRKVQDYLVHNYMLDSS